MGRFFVPLDVNYQLDDKIMSAGYVAECLYVRALAYCKRAGMEGHIKNSQLRALALGLPSQPAKHANTLVEVGLWDRTSEGYYIAGWLNHNLSNGELAEQKAKIRAKSIAGNHKRHHVAKGVVDDDCELCSPPSGEHQVSQRGTKNLATEEEDEQKTNRTEDEPNTKTNYEGLNGSSSLEKRVGQSRVTETGPRSIRSNLTQLLGDAS
jgi:hypothetical protein